MRVVVKHLVHHALVIASVPGDAERHRLDIRGGTACPGRAFPLSVASIPAMNLSTSATR